MHTHFFKLLLCGAGLVAQAQAANLLVTVLDRDGHAAADAVVVVVPSGSGHAPHPPPMSAVVVQEKMQFVPALTLVSPGARLRFVNNDPWDHHVRMSAPGADFAAQSNSAQGFALRLEGKTEGRAASFADIVLDQPGAFGASLLGCFIHGSMRGNVYVAESGWAVKTGADGVAQIDDLPDGPATLKVWHPALLAARAPQPLGLGAGTTRLTVQLDVVPRRRRL